MDQYTYICWKHRPAQYTTIYLEKDETQELMRDVGTHGVLLFQYYCMLAKAKEATEISDDRAADWFGWNVHTAARYRRALIKTGWLFIEKARLTRSRAVYLYHLGKPAVAKAAEQRRAP